MKNCTGCKYAKWDRTKIGRLSPTGNGICTYNYKIPKLPASMYWVGFDDNGPAPLGGYINRRENFKNDCIYFVRINRWRTKDAKVQTNR